MGEGLAVSASKALVLAFRRLDRDDGGLGLGERGLVTFRDHDAGGDSTDDQSDSSDNT